MITHFLLRRKALRVSGSALSPCCAIRLQCGRTLQAHGDRTPFTSSSPRTPGGCRSSGRGEGRQRSSCLICLIGAASAKLIPVVRRKDNWAPKSLIASQISVSRQCDDLSLRAIANVKDKADR